MDKALDKYEDDQSVVAVTGYSYPLNWHVSDKANIFKSKLLFQCGEPVLEIKVSRFASII